MAGPLNRAARSAAGRVGEPARDRRLLALLPQRHHDELAARPVLPAHEHEPPVADVDRAALPRRAGRRLARDRALGPGAPHPRDHLRAGVERPAHALAVPLRGVVGDGDERDQRAQHGRPLVSAAAPASGRPLVQLAGSLPDRLVLADVGVRHGFAPRWIALAPAARLIGFDADAEDARRHADLPDARPDSRRATFDSSGSRAGAASSSESATAPWPGATEHSGGALL
jgi:hypothetical protein